MSSKSRVSCQSSCRTSWLYHQFWQFCQKGVHFLFESHHPFSNQSTLVFCQYATYLCNPFKGNNFSQQISSYHLAYCDEVACYREFVVSRFDSEKQSGVSTVYHFFRSEQSCQYFIYQTKFNYSSLSIKYYNILQMHPKYAALFTSVNLLLGVGPLILPSPFFQAGVGLSTIWLVIIIFISYNSALYIAQAMSKIYFIEYQKSQQSLISSDMGSDLVDSTIQRPPQLEGSVENQNETIDPKNPLLKQETTQQKNQIQAIDHNQQFEILFEKPWGYRMKIATSIMITIYIGGTCVSKCIMTSKILSKVFDGQEIVGTIYFWLAIFFLSGAIFSFRSVEKTAGLQFIIILVRFVSILLMIGGAFFLMIRDGVKGLTPKEAGAFNFSSFTQIFSNTLFCLMFHHSFPSIAASVKNSADLSFSLRYAFLIAGSINMIIPWTGIMAFGETLKFDSSSSDLKYYNFDFEQPIPFIYYFVSFYVFLNVAAMPVYVIVIRGNILKILKPQIDSKVLSKTTLISTLIILAVILVISFFAQNFIQIVLDFTGGIFGVAILFIIPALQVYKARQISYKKGHKRNYIRWLPIFLITIGICFMTFNLYNVIRKL